MKKIIIGLTVPSVIKLIGEERNYLVAHTRLKQHKIVFSDVILEEYEKSLKEKDLFDSFQQWYSYYERFDGFFEFGESTSDNFEEDINSLLSSGDHSLLIKCNESICSKFFSTLELEDVNNDCSINELSIQCIPTNFILPKNSSKSTFCNWLKELLADEKTIKVVDRYIMSSNAKGVFEEIYLPTFPKDSMIHMYFGNDEKSQEEISILKKSLGDRIQMHCSVSSDFHERYIIGDSIIITIGVGLDVFECENNNSRKDTNVSVSTQTTIPTLPRRFVQRTGVYRY